MNDVLDLGTPYKYLIRNYSEFNRMKKIKECLVPKIQKLEKHCLKDIPLQTKAKLNILTNMYDKDKSLLALFWRVIVIL